MIDYSLLRNLSLSLLAPGAAAAMITAATTRVADSASSGRGTDPMWRHGTLAVVILESNQVVVAIDSRSMRRRFDSPDVVEDGQEKFVPLTSHTGFFNTGMGEFTNSVTGNSISMVQTAQAAASEINPRDAPPVASLAEAYRRRLQQQMARLSPSELRGIHFGLARLQQANVCHSVFVGRDLTGRFQLLRVSCDSRAETNGENVEVHLGFRVSDERTGERQQVLFFGETSAFAQVTNANSSLATIFRNLKSRRAVVAEPAAAALVDMGIRNYSGKRNPAGYPIFVYRLDAGGIQRTRVVNQGDRITFLPPGR